jgi:hypothetical protein
MPIPIPNLDDRTFADLVTEGRAMIPRLAPEWTNHNPSDPGITLVELFAWLTESLLYDLNQVRDDTYTAFLSLLASPAQPGESLDAAIARTVRSFSTLTRAARADDFTALAMDLAGGRAARATLIADRNLEGNSASEEGHVSVVVLPSASTIGLSDPASRTCAALNAAMSSAAVDTLRKDIVEGTPPSLPGLQDRLLVTTVLHVVAPAFTPVSARVRLVGRSDANPTALAADVEAALRRFLDPYDGGDDQHGWPFGRAVYKSELLQKLEGVAGVDHVNELIVNDDSTDNPVTLASHSLVCVPTVSVAVELEGGV